MLKINFLAYSEIKIKYVFCNMGLGDGYSHAVSRLWIGKDLEGSDPAFIEVLSPYLPGVGEGAEKNSERPESVSRPRFEAISSRRCYTLTFRYLT
jgi:hypothetical protein